MHTTPAAVESCLPPRALRSWILVLGALVLPAALRGEAGAQVAVPDSVVRPARCTMRVVDSAEVHLPDKRPVYIEPNSFVAAGRSLLLAGAPSYVFPLPGVADTGLARDSIFGVIRTPSGRWVPVTVPAPVRYFGGVRAAPAGEGEWHVIFIELATSMADQRGHGSSIAAWYGRLSAAGWSRVERLPSDDPDHMDPLNSTELLRRGDTLTWATHVRSPRTRLAGGVGLFESIAGKWRYRLLEPHAMHVHAAQLANGERRLFVRRERDARDAMWQLVQYALSPVPRPVDTLYQADDRSRMLNRLYRTTDGRITYNWYQSELGADPELHSIGVDGRGRIIGRRVIPFDYLRHYPLRAPDGARPWLVLGHMQDVGSGTPDGGQLQLAWVTPTQAWRDASIPHHFMGPPQPLMRSADRVDLTGPMQHPISSGGHIVSLVVSVGFTCPD